MKGKAKAAEFLGEGYQVHVTGRDVFVTEAMKAYAIEKVSKIERFSSRIIDVQITMDVQKLEHRVDIVLKVDHVKIKSHASSTDMYASIDKAVEKIDRQLRRYKQRIQEHNAKALNVVDLKVNVFKRPEEEEIVDINIEIDEENQKDLVKKYTPHEIVSQETRPLKTLNLEDALMKMELSEDAFLIFRAEDTRKLQVLYRRNDGHYALMQLES